MQQGLGRNTANIKTDAADYGIPFDQADLESKVCRGERLQYIPRVQSRVPQDQKYRKAQVIFVSSLGLLRFVPVTTGCWFSGNVQRIATRQQSSWILQRGCDEGADVGASAPSITRWS